VKKFNNLIFPALIIAAAAAMRVVPHLPNFAPITAMALFGGVYLPKRWAIILPLAAMFLSDIFIGFESIDGRAVVYGSFILVGLVGIWLKEHKNLPNIVGASLASSLVFYLITNFGVLYTENLYPRTVEGLIHSYYMALPFFRYTVAGDLFYTAVFFGSFELLRALTENRKLAFLKKEVTDGN
jgi:hypothetical protein